MNAASSLHTFEAPSSDRTFSAPLSAVPPLRQCRLLAATATASVAALFAAVASVTGISSAPTAMAAATIALCLVSMRFVSARYRRQMPASPAAIVPGWSAPYGLIAASIALPFAITRSNDDMQVLIIAAAAAAALIELLSLVHRWELRSSQAYVACGIGDAQRRDLIAVAEEIVDVDVITRDYRRIYVPAGALTQKRWRRFVRRASMQGTAVLPIALLAEGVSGRIDIDAVDADRSGAIAALAERGTSAGWNRTADIVFALLAGLLLVPLVALTAVIVLVTMGRPVFFVQPRVGKGGKIFKMIKFRTMIQSREANKIATVVGDPRVTPFGRLMRRVRLDELPQLWHILKGEMSLIGPRPEQPALVERYKQFIPNFDLRHHVKPGLTGWAQVRFGYAADVAETRGKLAYDLYYAANKSWRLDLRILLRTVLVLFNSRMVR